MHLIHLSMPRFLEHPIFDWGYTASHVVSGPHTGRRFLGQHVSYTEGYRVIAQSHRYRWLPHQMDWSPRHSLIDGRTR